MDKFLARMRIRLDDAQVALILLALYATHLGISLVERLKRCWK